MQEWSCEELVPSRNFLCPKKGVVLALKETDLAGLHSPKLQPTESPRPWEVGVRAGSLSRSHKLRCRDPGRQEMSQRIVWALGSFLQKTSGWPLTQLLFPQDGAAIFSAVPPLPHVDEWLVEGGHLHLKEPLRSQGRPGGHGSWKVSESGLLIFFPRSPESGVITALYSLEENQIQDECNAETMMQRVGSNLCQPTSRASSMAKQRTKQLNPPNEELPEKPERKLWLLPAKCFHRGQNFIMNLEFGGQ